MSSLTVNADDYFFLHAKTQPRWHDISIVSSPMSNSDDLLLPLVLGENNQGKCFCRKFLAANWGVKFFGRKTYRRWNVVIVEQRQRLFCIMSSLMFVFKFVTFFLFFYFYNICNSSFSFSLSISLPTLATTSSPTLPAVDRPPDPCRPPRPSTTPSY